jgi:hypothetical protein
MPTIRPRHLITETLPVAQALDAAAKRWPSEGGNRSRLLLRLVEEGHRAVMHEHEELTRQRRAIVARTSGALTGVYGDGYLRELREDWPE